MAILCITLTAYRGSDFVLKGKLKERMRVFNMMYGLRLWNRGMLMNFVYRCSRQVDFFDSHTLYWKLEITYLLCLGGNLSHNK